MTGAHRIVSALRAGRAAVTGLLAEDVFVTRLVVVFAAVQVTAAAWDLPGAWSWENDAVAPRELFNSVITNLTPGRGHNYPLFHSLGLFLLNIPIVLPGVLALESWDPETIRYGILNPAVMTPVLVVSKLVTIAMGVVALLTVGRITRRLFDPVSARWAVAFAACNLSVAYYLRTTNLDGPYMMWTLLAVDRMLSIVEEGSWRRYLQFAACAALAVATKDQAYGGFVIVAPYVFVVLPIVDRAALAAGGAHLRRLGLAFGASMLVYFAASGALFNPTGFAARIRMLAGPNSQDWRAYPPTLAGRWDNTVDAVSSLTDFWWPLPVVVLVAVGIIVAFAVPPGDRPLTRGRWRVVPLLVGLGAFISFTLVVGRNEHRFLLPQAFWAAVYAGVAAGAAVRWLGLAGTLASAASLALGVASALTLQLTQFGDPRWAVVEWLEANAHGKTVETYGLTVYQPHFRLGPDAPYRVRRVGPKRPERRNPLVGAEERQAQYAEVSRRCPDVLIVLDAFASRYLEGDGPARSKIAARAQAAVDATTFFRAAVADRLVGYKTERVFTATLPAWAAGLGAKPLEVHGSTARPVRVLVRRTPCGARAADRDVGRSDVRRPH